MAQVAPVRDSAPVPPQNLEAEESVLGAMMLSPGAIGAVSEILDAGDFYRESHGKIYRAALDLYGHSEPVDAITLVDALEERGSSRRWAGAPASRSWRRSSRRRPTWRTTRRSSTSSRRCAA